MQNDLGARTEPGVVADFFALAKPGIVRMVLVTTAVGFALAGGSGNTLFSKLFVWCLIGTALSAAGANALNMAVEIDRDSRMERTRRRPMPAGRMSFRAGVAFGVVCSIGGVLILWLGANPAAAMVSLATILSYVLIYTPMKPVTPLSTVVGAVPGALPPLIGWAAGSAWGTVGGVDSARSLFQAGGWSLFLIMFVWQIPHFLALAWKYREEYGRAGHNVLPVADPSGTRTSFVVLMWSVLLIPVSLLPAAAIEGGRIGWAYATVAFVLGLGHLAIAARLARERTDAAAMKLFFASIIYLPLVLLALVADALIPWPS